MLWLVREIALVAGGRSWGTRDRVQETDFKNLLDHFYGCDGPFTALKNTSKGCQTLNVYLLSPNFIARVRGC